VRGRDGDSAETAETSETAEIEAAASEVATTETVTTEAPTSTTSTTIADRAEWVTHSTEAPCQCADGSEYVFHTLDRDPDNVLLYYQGGGACFTEEMCSFENGTYKVTTGIDDHPTDESGGIWDDDNPDNPFADWSIVFMPYCTATSSSVMPAPCTATISSSNIGAQPTRSNCS
jgi:hypothetical protein